MLREKDELTDSVSGEARECESRSQRVRVVLLVLSRECGPRERERERALYPWGRELQINY